MGITRPRHDSGLKIFSFKSLSSLFLHLQVTFTPNFPHSSPRSYLDFYIRVGEVLCDRDSEL